ncbi:MAG TPA: amino acid adenylation domain-containing protein [Blastocatellia bacterium]|nr:amino acid adenylation domain-containing protein [Blastocatellia bacterium]
MDVLSSRSQSGNCLPDILSRRAEEHGDKIAYTYLGDGENETAWYTYRRLYERSLGVAHELRSRRMEGERILLTFEPGLEFIVGFFGCLYAGAIAVPCNFPSRPRQMPRLFGILEDCGPKAILTDAKSLARLNNIAAKAAPRNWASLTKLATDGIPDGSDATLFNPSANDIAFLQYTSGSTSEPKGVIITHENLIWNQEMIRLAFRQDSSSLVVGWLPVHHDMGLIGNALQPLYVGAQCVLMPPPTFIQKPLRWLSAIAKYRATTSGGPNFAYDLCVRRIGQEDRAHLDLSSWSVAFNGSEPVRAETLASFAETFAECGFRTESFFPCYGLAEATLFVTGGGRDGEPFVNSVSRAGLAQGQVIPAPAGDAKAARLVSCGRPWLDHRIEIVDPESLTANPPGKVGEVWVAGPSIASGYWNRPEESGRVFFPATTAEQSKRLRTGDLGYLLDGMLFLTGRLKDLIIIRGRNLYPQDLELTAERAIPALEPSAGAAFSIDTEQGEQLVLVNEIRRAAQPAFDEIAQAVSQAIASEHEVTLFDFVLLRPGTLPRTTSGKVRRSKCKIRYLEDRLEVVKSSRAVASLPALDNSKGISSPEQFAQSHFEGALSTVEQVIRSIVSQKLRLPASLIAPDIPLMALGLDSLRGIELAHELESQFGCSLSLSQLLESASARTLASQIVDLASAGVDDNHQYAFHSSVSNQLSPGQRALYILERLSDSSSPNNLFAAGWIEGGLNIQAIHRAAESLILRHAALRTTFAEDLDGAPTVHETLAIDFDQWQLQPEDLPRVGKLFEKEAHRPFDLNTGPLLRLRVCRLGEDRFALLLVTHHLVTDLRSIEILLSDLGRLYEQEISDVSAELGDPPPSFAEFVALQTSNQAGPKGKALREYWREALRDLPALDLPTDKPRPAVQTFRGAMRRRRLPDETLRETKELARKHGTTLFTVLITTLQCLLSRYTGQTDLVVGSAFSGRSNPRFNRSIGYFLNPLPFRADLTGNPSFEDMLIRNKRAILEAFAHADFPSALMTEEMSGVFDPSRPPLFQVFFTFEQSSLPEFESLPAFILGRPGIRLQLGPLPIVSMELERRTSQFDLLIYATEIMSEMQIAVEYNTDLFEDFTIDQFMKCFQTALESASRAPQRFISELEILDPEERKTQLAVWNNPKIRESDPGRCLHRRCLHQIFEERAAYAPTAIAVVDGLIEISYSDLNDRAEALARRLRSYSVGPEMPVALCFESSIDMIVAILSVLKAGGAYLPLDPNQPPDRLQYILKDCIRCTGLRVILTHRPVFKLAADLADAAALELINCEQIEGPIDGATVGAAAPEVLPDNLAYIIYTSGSTGQPKGVMNTHANVVRLFEETRETFSFGASDVWTMFHSYSFDFSVWEMWGALLFGGRLVIVAYEVSRAPQKFYDLLRYESVTILNQTPSAFRQLANLGEPWGERYGFQLRTVVFGGEAVDLSSLKSWLASYEGNAPTLVNMYGITETTVHVTYRALDRADLEVNAKSLIGCPIADLQVYLLDSYQELLPVGAVGAMYVGGAGLARGYLGRPDLTAERFAPNYFSSIPGDRLYQSGDLARYLRNGELEYLGRLDNQVKIRGHRIEPGEIQYVLNGYPAVSQSHVIACEDKYGDTQLLAYLTLSTYAAATESDLRSYLSAKLPSYMVPNAIITLNTFPLTSRGKIDDRALPPPETIDQQAGILSNELLTPSESALALIWTELLGTTGPRKRDGFFDLGGHSLLAIRMVNRIKEIFNVDLPIATIFKTPTLSEIAAAIDDLRYAGFESPVIRRIQSSLDHSFTQKLPLSFAQQRLWFFEQLEPGQVVYNCPIAVRLKGNLDITTLEQAISEVIRRHEVLRSTFDAVDGKPMQVVGPPYIVKAPVIDLTEVEESKRADLANELVSSEAHGAFDLERGPLLRIKLLKLQRHEYLLLVTMHHIIGDRWSIGVFEREIGILYKAYREGRVSPLEELAIQYADYAAWQRDWLQGEILEHQLSYWEKQLSGASPTDILADYSRPAIHSFQGAEERLGLSGSLTGKLRLLSRQEGVTLFMTLLAGFQTLLSRYTSKDDIVVGAPVSNRNRIEVEGLIGCFVNMLALRTSLSGNPSFRELLRRVRKTTTEAYARQDMPFEILVENLQPVRASAYMPLLHTLFIFHNTPEFELVLPDLTLNHAQIDFAVPGSDLGLIVSEETERLTLSILYSTDLFESGAISRMLNCYKKILEEAAEYSDSPIRDLEILADEERRQILEEWNKTDVEGHPADKCVHRLIEEQAGKTPDATALICGGEIMSYGELDNRSNRLAHYLRRLGVKPEGVVGICIDRSLEVIVSVLGVLKAGGAYAPLDPGYPRRRLKYMLEDSGATVVLCRRPYEELFVETGVQIVDVIEHWEEINKQDGEKIRDDAQPENLAYVIYTSGSTGLPKGAMNRHAGLLNRLLWMRQTHQICREDRMLHKTSFSFDVSVPELLLPLMAGAQMVIAEPEGHKDSLYLARLIQEQGITITHFVPSMLRVFLEEAEARQCKSLRYVICSGEELTTQLRDELSKKMGVQLENLYGPTEAAIEVTRWSCEGTSARARVPIGKPIWNTQIHILDEEMQPVPIGAPGEIYIGGMGVARGYINKGDRTAECFLPNPFGRRSGARMYRTRDLGRYLADGNIEYLGRIDHQTKIRGYRIELGEIESIVRQVTGIEEAVVVTREDENGDKSLIGYFVCEKESPLTAPDLIVSLRRNLPDYMVPHVWIRLDRMPLTAGGKIDRKELPAPEQTSRSLREEYVAPRTINEEIIAGIFCEVLRIERVGIHDNFFDLGGHSLLATQVVSRLRKAFQTEIPVKVIFTTGFTVAEMAKVIMRRQAEQLGMEEPAGVGIQFSKRSAKPGDPELIPRLRRQIGLNVFPLSFAQQRLWFINELQGSSAIYHVSGVFRIKGGLNIAAFEGTLNEIVRRHEALRTCVISQNVEPVQEVRDFGVVTPVLIDLEGLGRTEQEGCVKEIAREEAAHEFDLGSGMPIRAKLLRQSNNEHVLLVTMHHIVSDGWSLGILASEIAELYRAFSAGAPSPLSELELQYADFAVWQREWAQGAVLQEQLQYWKEQLSGVSALELPTDRPRPAMPDHRGGNVAIGLSSELTRDLKVLGRREGVTLFMTLLAGFQVLLARYAGQDDVAVGTPIAGRTHEQTEGLIGFFVNTLVMRADLSSHPTARSLLRQIKEKALGAYSHQDLPFEMLVKELRPERNLGREPLFQVMFVFQNAPQSERKLGDLSLCQEQMEGATAKFDLTLSLEEMAGEIRGSLEYATELYDRSRMERLLEHLKRILEGMTADPEGRVMGFPLLTEAERAQVVAWNRTEMEYPGEKCVHQLFEEQAERTPEAVAVIYEDRRLSYGELNRRANRLAHHLRAMGVAPESLVGLCIERSVEMVIGLMGILKAGGAYLPLDSGYPKSLLEYMLEDGAPAVVLTQSWLVERLSGRAPQVVCLDADWERIGRRSDANPVSAVCGENLAYIMYTSGSTGNPKGVMGLHCGAVNRFHWMWETYPFAEGEVCCQKTSLSFGDSIWEIFGPLLRGTPNVIIPDSTVKDPMALTRMLSEQRVTRLVLVPSLLRALLDYYRDNPGEYRGVKLWVSSGERLPLELASRFAELMPGGRLLNLYGSSEVSADVSWSDLNETGAADGEVKIGRPIANTSLYLLDRDMQLAPEGVSGEIYAGGGGLGRGYLNRPELTAEKFVPDGWSGEAGGRLYKTGDQGRYGGKGGFEYLGRLDHQVKVRGYRIELGEIEAALKQHEAVRDVVVTAREEEEGQKRLVAYVVSRGEESENAERLRSYLKQRLPEYMSPSVFVFLENLPLTASGKVDRRTLPEPGRSRPTLQGDFVEPSTELERILAEVWKELLKLDRVGVRDNFFELGGDSIISIQVVTRARQAGVDITPMQLFQYQTIAELAETAGSAGWPLVEQGAAAEEVPLTTSGHGVSHYREKGAGEYTPSDFSLVDLTQAQLDQILKVAELSDALEPEDWLSNEGA